MGEKTRLGRLKDLWDKFRTTSRANKLLIIFTVLCFLVPFAVVRSPMEMISHVLPIWLPLGAPGLFGITTYWLYTGMPFWRTFLAVYGATSFGIILFYSGTAGLMYFLPKWKWFSKIKLKIFKDRRGDNRINGKENGKTKLGKWLARQNIWFFIFLLILFLLLPLPWTDQVAAVAMKLKNVKYGLWYLLALNAAQSLIVLFCVYFGISLIIF